MICRCSKRVGFTVNMLDGKPNNELWVCANCGGVPRRVFEVLTGMLTPNDTTILLHEKGRADGIHELTWDAPGGRKVTLVYFPFPRKVEMQEQAVYLLNMWRMLDQEVKGLMVPQNPAAEYHKNRARAFAEVIQMLMGMFYPTVDDVVREALERYKAHQEDRIHETPGLSERVWDPMNNYDGSPRVEVGKPKSRAPRAVNSTQLNEQQKVFVAKALADNSLEPAVLAGMFKVDVAVIEACRG